MCIWNQCKYFGVCCLRLYLSWMDWFLYYVCFSWNCWMMHLGTSCVSLCRSFFPMALGFLMSAVNIPFLSAVRLAICLVDSTKKAFTCCLFEIPQEYHYRTLTVWMTSHVCVSISPAAPPWCDQKNTMQQEESQKSLDITAPTEGRVAAAWKLH